MMADFVSCLFVSFFLLFFLSFFKDYDDIANISASSSNHAHI